MFVAGALMGITVTIWLSRKLQFRFLEFLGRNSLILFAVHGVWLRGYSYLLSLVTREHYKHMINIPDIYCFVGLFFVAFMAIVTFYLLRGIYGIYYEKLKNRLKF